MSQKECSSAVERKPAEGLPEARKAFGSLLQWHLKRGSRPSGVPALNSLVWTQKEFAYAVRGSGVGGETAERSVRNWCSGRSIPYDLKQIEPALFGPQPQAGKEDVNIQFRLRLRLAFQRAKGRVDPADNPLPDQQRSQQAICSDPGRCFGRDGEIARVRRMLLSEPDGAAVLILGNAGNGKTMLTRAVGVSRDVIAHFGSRRWFVELDRCESAEAALAEIAGALGVERTEGWQALQDAIGQEDRPGLLVLDNLETPLHASQQRLATEQLLRDLLAIPGLSIVASLRSQETVGAVPWRDEIAIEPLSATDSQAMFLSIARTIDPADPDLAYFVGEHGELAGIPLAIFLVAHRVFRHTKLAALKREWQKQGALLAKLPGAPDLRGDSLVASIEFSLHSKRMKEEGWRLFSLLGQLPAGLSDFDCEALMGADGHEGAAQLRSVGLLRDLDDSRIGLLPPVRDVASRRFRDEGSEAAGWIAHYLALLEEQGVLLGKTDGRSATLRLIPEMPNISAAMAASARSESGIGSAMQLLRQFENATLYTGFGAEAALVRLQAACAESGNKAGQGKCLSVIADKARLRGNNALAKASFLAALDHLQDTDSYRETGLCYWGLAELSLSSGEYVLAAQWYGEARLCFQQAAWPVGEADCIAGLASIADQTDDYLAAIALFNEASVIFEQFNRIRSKADCFWYLAEIERKREQFSRAGHLYEAARDLCIVAGHQSSEADSLIGLAQVAAFSGSFAVAQELLDTARDIPRHADVTGDARYFLALADFARFRGEASLAEQSYKRAHNIYKAAEFFRGQADCQFGLAASAQLRADYAAAEVLYRASMDLYETVGGLLGPANCLSALADITFPTDQSAARRLNEQALELYCRANALIGAKRCREKLASWQSK